MRRKESENIMRKRESKWETNLQSCPSLHFPVVAVEQSISPPGECACLRILTRAIGAALGRSSGGNRTSTGLRGIIVAYSLILCFSLESKGEGAWGSLVPGALQMRGLPSTPLSALRQPGLGLGLSHTN